MIVTLLGKEPVERISGLFDRLFIDFQGCKCFVVFWCLKCPKNFIEQTKGICGDAACVVTAEQAPLCQIALFLSRLPSFNKDDIACFVSSEIIVKENAFEFITSKMKEYDISCNSIVLTSEGFRFFPHTKCVEGLISEGIHWKKYTESHTDREVHVFSPDFCIFTINVLLKLQRLQDDTALHRNAIWLSFLLSFKLKPPVHIWKIKTSDAIALISDKSGDLLSLIPEDKGRSSIFQQLYSELYDLGWPEGISNPGKTREICTNLSNDESCSSIWHKGFGGVNMPFEPASELDFEAAAAYGVKVIRVGAVCDAKDLIFLLNSESHSVKDDMLHLSKVIPRLRKGLLKANSFGLKVIITMADLPGCPFHSGSSKSFWNSSYCRERVVKFWGFLAKHLSDLKNTVMGYDLINEPYTLEDTDCDFFDEMPMAHTTLLHEFYAKSVQEIRKSDSTVGILLKGLWFASPRAIESIQPIPDPFVFYGFHAYIPPILTLPHAFKFPSQVYPGPVPKWISYQDEKVDVNYEKLHKLLKETVYAWQIHYNVPSRQIVAAEFGISREVEGASLYLSDLIHIFESFEWSWMVFSFRDEEWDSLDYELGTDKSNVLHRSTTDLFLTVAKHFH